MEKVSVYVCEQCYFETTDVISACRHQRENNHDMYFSHSEILETGEECFS